MAEQITTAAELDALPDSSVISFRFSQHHREYAAIKRGGRWYVTGIFDARGYQAQELLDDGAAGVVVLYRPDAEPAPVKPSLEDVAGAIWSAVVAEHERFGTSGPLTLGDWEEAYDNRSMADAVLALLPGRAEAEVKAEALEEEAESFLHLGLPERLRVRGFLLARAARLRGESNV